MPTNKLNRIATVPVNKVRVATFTSKGIIYEYWDGVVVIVPRKPRPVVKTITLCE
jgi:hypothetical protein